jgi:outer membrane protein, heavy metal efflux system
MTPTTGSFFTASTLCCALLFAVSPAIAEDRQLGASLDELIAYARQHNPELAAQRLEAEAARERIAPASALPDPKFQVELMDFTNAMSGGSTSLLPGEVGQTRYRIIQPLPFYGKRERRGEVAGALAGQATRSSDAAALDVEARIRIAYTRYYQAAGQAAIVGEALTLVEALGRLVETRYSVGLVPQQDVLRAHSEVTSLKLDLVDIERRRRDAAAQLNAQLPRRADAPLANPQSLPAVPDRLAFDALVERARSASPELARERLGVDAAASSRELVHLNRYPDFSLGLTNNRPKSGKDNWDLMLEVNIPLQQSSRRAQEREAEHRLNAAQSRVAAAETRLDGRIGETLAAFEASSDKARLLRDTLLPQSRANLDAAQAGYESGRVNFNTLIEAERQVLRSRLALLDAETEIRIRHTELERLAGAPL